MQGILSRLEIVILGGACIKQRDVVGKINGCKWWVAASAGSFKAPFKAF